MPYRVEDLQIEHRVVGTQHVFDSPVMPGLFVAHSDEERARNSIPSAVAMLGRIIERRVMPMPHVHREIDLPYLPTPNVVDTIVEIPVGPLAVTRSAFVLPFLEDGSLVLANVNRRGAEIPGGHLEGRELPIDAAHRECLEETGCELDDLVPVGFLRLHSEGDRPDGWKYPHPTGAQQFFAAKVKSMRTFDPNDECGAPTIVPPDEIENVVGLAYLPFVRKAIELLFELPAPAPNA